MWKCLRNNRDVFEKYAENCIVAMETYVGPLNFATTINWKENPEKASQYFKRF